MITILRFFQAKKILRTNQQNNSRICFKNKIKLYQRVVRIKANKKKQTNPQAHTHVQPANPQAQAPFHNSKLNHRNHQLGNYSRPRVQLQVMMQLWSKHKSCWDISLSQILKKIWEDKRKIVPKKNQNKNQNELRIHMYVQVKLLNNQINKATMKTWISKVSRIQAKRAKTRIKI